MSKLREIEETMLGHDDPVVSVPELAEEMDRSTTHIRDQLRLLEREGVVASKDVGARATAWWHVKRLADPQTVNEAPPSRTARKSPQPDQGAPDDPHGAGESPPTEWTVEEAAEAIEVPGNSEEVVEQRREAIQTMLEHLRDHGPAPAAPLREAGFEAGTGYQSEDSWWRNCGSEALSNLRDIGAVDLQRPGREWEWAGGVDE